MKEVFYDDLLDLLRERNHLLREELLIMATLDTDVQEATTLIGDLVAALNAASNPTPPVSQADQDALEAAIAAGQAALTPAPVETPLSFTPALSVSTALGQPASFSVGSATGGTPPYTFAVSSLPDGLSADTSGNVTGTPTASGSTSISVQVSDSAGNSASGSVSLTVA